MEKLYKLISILILTLLLTPQLAAAATFSVSPSEGIFDIGQAFSAQVIINTEGERISVAEGTISFPSDILEIKGISREGSIFNLWVQEPTVAGNTIKFVGGVTGGFTGVGKVFTVTFETKNYLPARVKFESGTRILNYSPQLTNVLTGTDEANYPFKIPASIPDEYRFEKVLTSGDRNIDVAYLQIVLASDPEIYEGPLTGYFSSETLEAVKAFQKKYTDEILTPQGLTEPTGIIDQLTRDKLNGIAKILKEEEPTLFDVEIKPVFEKAGRNPVVTAGILIIAAYIIYRIIAAYKKRKRKNYNLNI